MQRLQSATIRRVSPDLCAKELLIGVPVIMRFIRHQMRGHRQAELTVPQFRTLVFLSHSEDSSLSATAEHLGLSLPATSRMVDLLVRRGLMERRPQAADRRRVSLSLTHRGQEAFRTALEATEKALSGSFKSLSPQELTQVIGAMRTLSRVFASSNGHPESSK
jgi:DNA-binding MarR family transcriptional regulator